MTVGGFRYILLFTTQIITIVDCILLFKGGQLLDNGALPLQLFRLLSASFFISTCLIFEGSLLIFLLTIYSTSATIILFGLCSFYDFRSRPIEFYLEVISAFFSWGVTLDELFAKFDIKEFNLTDIVQQQNKNSDENPKGTFEKFLTIVSQNSLAISTLAAVGIAIICGVLIRAKPDKWSQREAMYISYFGELFLRILKCLVLPLIFSSLLYAFANIDLSLSGKVAFRTITLYLFTMFAAIFIGIALVLVIKPGVNPSDSRNTTDVVVTPITTADSILDLFRNIFPDNFFSALISYEITLLNCTKNQPLDECPIGKKILSGANILGVVMFSVIMGVVVTRVENRVFMLEFFRGINDIFMEMTILAINVMPFCVIFLIMPRIITVGDLSILFGSVGWYSVTVLIGLFIQCLLILPLLYFVFIRKNPYVIYKHLAPALIMGFGTSSSSVTMPITIKCLEERVGLDKRIVRFCIPIGTTINMDGTALYEAVAAIFISQYREIPLSFAQIFVVALTATAAAIGAAGIPQAGLVTMIIVLNAVNLPPQDAALIILVDWALDRCRTVCNIVGDCYATSIVDDLSKNEIKGFDLKLNETNKNTGKELTTEKTDPIKTLIGRASQKSQVKFLAKSSSKSFKKYRRTPSILTDGSLGNFKSNSTITSENKGIPSKKASKSKSSNIESKPSRKN